MSQTQHFQITVKYKPLNKALIAAGVVKPRGQEDLQPQYLLASDFLHVKLGLH